MGYLPNGKLKDLRREIFSVSDDYYERFIFRKSLVKLREDVPEKYREIAATATETDFSYTDEYLDRIEPYIVGEGSRLDGFAYCIGNVIVSLPKVKRIWKAIKNAYNDDYDLEKLFMFAITYGSYYVDSELQELRSIINERKLD